LEVFTADLLAINYKRAVGTLEVFADPHAIIYKRTTESSETSIASLICL